MPIEVKKALEILSEVLAGEKPKKFFQQNIIAEYGLQIQAETLNKKLQSRRPFTKADHVRLAHYFRLGEEGFKLFQVENEEAFRAGLRNLGVGKYNKDPAQILSQKLFIAAKESSATLELINIPSSRINRAGLVSPENAQLPLPKGLTLRAGDHVRLRFDFPVTEGDPLWFSVFNIQSVSGPVRVLNPIFKESAIQLHSGHLDFPEYNDLEIRDDTFVGSHRLIAIAGTSDFRKILLKETSRLLTLWNGTDEWNEDNRFDGLLDRTALENINQASLTGVIHCAVLEYRQVHGAQQP